MSRSWELLARHAALHNGTVTRGAAGHLDIADHALDGWHRSGLLERRAPDVYVIAGAPPSWRQRAAIATGSTEGWASHRTAAALWELDGSCQSVIEVLTPFHRRRRRTDWIVHESRRIAGVDLDEVDGIPCTSVTRTVLDLPAVVHPFMVAQALDHACRRWPGMLDVIVQRHLELASRGRRGSSLMRAMLEERLGRGRFAQSGFETTTLRLVRSVGLPEPVLQHQVRDGDFVCYLDLAWPPIRWAVECDSLAWHSGKRSHEWDRSRRRRLKQLGWEVVEVTYDDVTKRRRETGDQLRTLYRARELAVERFCRL